MRLKNKVAIITGANRGIGLGIATAMAKEGAQIVIASRKLEEATETANLLSKKYHVNTLAVGCDISKSDQVKSLVAKTVQKFKRIDILVNNAGVAEFAPLLKMAEADWDRTLDVNLKGTFLCIRNVAEIMVKQKYGKIVSVASIAGLVGFDNLAHYCASKAGIIGMTRELALELSPQGINVNAIAPGVIETRMTDDLRKDKKQLAGLLAQIPMGRLGQPEDIAQAAVFLASDQASFITGHTLVVDGGWICR